MRVMPSCMGSKPKRRPAASTIWAVTSWTRISGIFRAESRRKASFGGHYPDLNVPWRDWGRVGRPFGRSDAGDRPKSGVAARALPPHSKEWAAQG
jgi:hypothetical protein